jgi:hypothetical protein
MFGRGFFRVPWILSIFLGSFQIRFTSGMISQLLAQTDGKGHFE